MHSECGPGDLSWGRGPGSSSPTLVLGSEGSHATGSERACGPRAQGGPATVFAAGGRVRSRVSGEDWLLMARVQSPSPPRLPRTASRPHGGASPGGPSAACARPACAPGSWGVGVGARRVQGAEHGATALTWTSTGSSVWASSVSRSSMVMTTCPVRCRNMTWGRRRVNSPTPRKTPERGLRGHQ